MNFVIGFGSTEADFEDAEFLAIEEFAKAKYRELGCSYVTDELTGAVEAFVKDRAASLRKASAEYATAETYPDRYSDYSPTILSDASYIACILRLNHYNRRHALSPDGWALMQRRECRVVLYEGDMS